MRLNNELTPDEYANKKEELLAKQDRQEKLIEETSSQINMELDISPEDFSSLLRQVFANGDPQTKKDILKFMATKITLASKKVSIYLHPALVKKDSSD